MTSSTIAATDAKNFRIRDFVSRLKGKFEIEPLECITILTVGVIFVFGMKHVVELGIPAINDEVAHFLQIKIFLSSRLALWKSLTNIPGFHAVVYGFASWGVLLSKQLMPHLDFSFWSNIQTLRVLSFSLSLLCIPAFYCTAQKIDRNSALIRTLQFTFLPIAVPYYFILYTDIATLSVFLVTIWLTLHRKYWLAGLFFALTLTFRQLYIPWIVLLMGMTIAQEYKTQNLRSLAWLNGGFLVSIAAFIAFVLVNGGIALNDKAHHPFPNWHWINIYLILLYSFVLLLPIHIGNLWRVRELLASGRTYFVLGIIAIVFFYTFGFDHLNQYDIGSTGSLHFRKRILFYFTYDNIHKLAMLPPILFAILSLSTAQLAKNRYLLIYPVSIVTLGGSWLSDPRYYIPIFALFLLFRKMQGKLIEISLLALSMVLSGLTYWGILKPYFLM